MIGSRLLFGGYRIGYKLRPVHAGFLGQDTLLVHDEAHLEPSFQEMIESIQRLQNPHEIERALRVVAMSATMRDTDKAFRLDDADRGHPILRQRLSAHKVLQVHKVAQKDALVSNMVDLAQEHSGSGDPILIYAEAVDTVQKIEAQLSKTLDGESVRVLTGTMRGRERDRLVDDPVFRRFLPGETNEKTGTVFLVSTSAGEVGVNLSAKHLVCDLVTFERMAQRFGRVNRFGDDPPLPSRIDIVVLEDALKSKKPSALTDALVERVKLLKELESHGSAGPNSLEGLPPERRAAAFSPPAPCLPVTDILLDALTMTSIRELLPGRPDQLEPYLHGLVDERPQVTVAWREEVSRIRGDLTKVYYPEWLLECFPLKPHELLRETPDRIFKQLKDLAKCWPSAPVWLVDRQNRTSWVQDGRPLSLLSLVNDRDRNSLAGLTVVLPPEVGGLSESGLMDGSAAASGSASLDVSEEYSNPSGDRLRMRTWSDEAPGQEWRLVCRLDLGLHEEESEEKVWFWYERAWGGDGLGVNTGVTEVPLADHGEAVAAIAAEMARRTGLDEHIVEAVSLAGKWHDSVCDPLKRQRHERRNGFLASLRRLSLRPH